MTSETSPRLTRKYFRFWAGVIGGILWLLLLLLAGEVWEVAQERRLQGAIDQLNDEAWSKGAEARAAVCERFGITPPAPVGADIVSRNAFGLLSGAERADYAQKRSEAVLVCEFSGRISESYLSATEPSIAAAMSVMVGAGDIVAGMSNLRDEGTTDGEDVYSMQANDLRGALGMVSSSGFQFREYELPMPGGGRDVAQFTVHPLKEGGPVAVFVRPSLWKKVWVDFRPGIHHMDADDIAINSHGFRDREIQVPKPGGVFRIVCVGGSTTAEGPTNELTYPKLLERILRERYGTERIEVVNAGVYASNSNNEMRRADQYLALEPDLLLHYNGVNDITQWLPIWMEAEGMGEFPLSLLKSLGRRSRLIYNNFNTALLPSDERLRRGFEENVFTNLRGLLGSAEARGVATVFASFGYPDYENLPPVEQALFDRQINHQHWGRTVNMEGYIHVLRQYNDGLKRLCEESGATYLPFAEGFRHGANFYTDICHMNVGGMLAKAELLAELLAPLLDASGVKPL